MDGYQSGDPNRVLAQLSSIFTVIQFDGIAYANPLARIVNLITKFVYIRGEESGTKLLVRRTNNRSEFR